MKINYLNNKDMLVEINKSKMSYCEFTDPDVMYYDVIVEDIDQILDPEVISRGIQNRKTRLLNWAYQAQLKINPKTKLSEFMYNVGEITQSDLVFRVITYEHIPENTARKRKPRTEAEYKVKLNFVPFIHCRLIDNEIVTVLKSHYKNGEFCQSHGKITEKLASMYMLLVNRYGQRANWRSYSYLEEMKGQALLQLVQMGLQFNELKSDNPFAYFTSSIDNSFTRIFNIEKRHQSIRDDLLISSGQAPSLTRQIEDEGTSRQYASEKEE